MKLLILQLSDIHICDADDPVLIRGDKIVEAVRNVAYDLDLCVVVISGDVAYSGRDDQFMLALDFLQKIRDRLRSDLHSDCPVEFAIVPGNHDCDFDAGGPTRIMLLDGVLAQGKNAVIDTPMMKVCTEVQNQFFGLRDVLSEVAPVVTDQLYWEYSFEKNGERVLLRCCNTAWASRIKERAAQLYFPVDRLKKADAAAQLVITVFHHPYNWLVPPNHRDFRAKVEEASDIVLTGHEHEVTIRSQRSSKGETNVYIEGGALQETGNPNISQFNAILLDTGQRRQKVFSFGWDGSMYLPDNAEPEWEDYQVNKLRTSNQFELRDETITTLNDLGLTVTHPSRGDLGLNDVFVYPDLREVVYKVRESVRQVRGELLIDLIDEKGHLLITGADKSGKTSLTKRLFEDYRRGGSVPVLLNGQHSRFSGDEKMYAECVRSFEELYRSPNGETYRQLDRARRAVIIDDFHQLQLRKASVRDVLARLSEFAGYVVLVAHDVSHQVTSIIRDDLMTEGSLGFVEYRIQPFGHVRRNELAEKWFALDDAASANPTDVARRVVEAIRVMDTAIGNFVPPYPVVLLPILQALQYNEPVNTNASTYGYFFELLIRRALAKEATHEAVDVKLGYLTFLAGHCFSTGRLIITEKELRGIHGAYEKHTLLTVPFRQLIDSLVSSKLLHEANGSFTFEHSYVFYYFAALGIRDTLGSERTRKQVSELVETIHTEQSGNILLFVAHLTKDPFVVNAMLHKGKQIFSEAPEAHLRLEQSPLIGVEKSIAQMAYNESADSRRRLLERLDTIESNTGEHEAATPRYSLQSETETREEMDSEVAEMNKHLMRFSAAFRTLQILGQLLKNFIGTMDGDTKRRLADECIAIGLRTLGSYLAVIEHRGGGYAESLVEMMRAEDPNLSDEDLSRKARQSLFGLLHMATYGVVKRVSIAIGSPHLGQVYELLQAENGSPTIALVLTSLKLDQFSQFPESDILGLHLDFEDNTLADTVLRSLVINHFHIFDEAFGLKQRVCAKLGIQYKPSLTSNPREKLLKA
jgi:hypothetical protein